MKNACARNKRSRQAAASINPRDVTAVILTRDEARNLPFALRSLPSDMPVLVLDHQSTDGTARLAEEAGARVIVRPFEGFVRSRLYALSQVETDWTFMIDADERADGDLVQSLREAREDVNGYQVARTTLYCGKPLRMWRGERLVRLFKTAHARLQAQPIAGGRAHLHERWHVDGETPLLRGTLWHESYPTHASYAQKYAAYTDEEARGVNFLPSRALAETLRAPLRFGWYTFGRGAALDGVDGLRVALWSAAYPAVVQWKSRTLR